MKLIFIIQFLLLLGIETTMGQDPNSMVGEWKVSEWTTNRWYINFEKDSVSFFNIEDTEKYKSSPFKKEMSQIFEEIGHSSILISNDSQLVFKLPGVQPLPELYSYHPGRSMINFGKQPNQDSIKVISGNLLQFATGDDYEKNSWIFKRKNQTRPEF